jgi:hypothetical protein
MYNIYTYIYYVYNKLTIFMLNLAQSTQRLQAIIIKYYTTVNGIKWHCRTIHCILNLELAIPMPNTFHTVVLWWLLYQYDRQTQRNLLNPIMDCPYVNFFGLHVSVIHMTIIRSVRAKEIVMQQRSTERNGIPLCFTLFSVMDVELIGFNIHHTEQCKVVISMCLKTG